MEQVIRHELSAELDEAIARSPLVTVSAAAAGGGVTTALRQWGTETARRFEFGTCPDFNPQRPLAAFTRRGEEATSAILRGDWDTAAEHLAHLEADAEEPAVFVVDNADHIDEASSHLITALLDVGCRVVLGHHHAPSTNPSLEVLIEGVPETSRASLVVPPFGEADINAALGDGTDCAAALAVTGGNPLALSLYRGSRFASIAVEVLERFDRLPADGQGLAAILSASPEPIRLDVLDAMGRKWETHGRLLERSDLIVVDANQMSLRHDKIRRVLYEEMTAVRRRFVHAEILGHLTESDGLTSVMHHAVGAGDVETIITLGPEAAERAADLGAGREAIKHLENVLAYEHSVPEADRSILKDALDRYLPEATG